jgi:outer membrane protein OmpA-like peptidoglycan-associated protein
MRRLNIFLVAVGLFVASAGSVYAAALLRFTYDVSTDGFVRRVSGTVPDWQGLQEALAPLQPPAGAHGAYGLIGDDELLGREPGYGLRQLGAIARQYVDFDAFYVEQPPMDSEIGVQAGTFTDVSQLNDTTLGWVMFDLRSKFEADIAARAAMPPLSFSVFFDYQIFDLTPAAQDVVKAAADAYQRLGSVFDVQLIGHADSAEADDSAWQQSCDQLSAADKQGEPACLWGAADPLRLGMMRAGAVSDELLSLGVPPDAIERASAGTDDPLIPTAAGEREPMNRRVTIELH